MKGLLTVVLLVGAAGIARAVPVLETGRQIGSLTVYRDHLKPNLYYYGPGKLQLKTGVDGAPDVSFQILRYTGNATSGDSGTIRFHSYLGFRVGWEAQGDKIKATLAALQKASPGCQLIGMPVRKSKCTVAFTPLEGGATRTISGGALVEDGKADSSGPFYEKSVLLCPDEVSSEAIWGIMKAGGTPVSLNCELEAEVYDKLPPKSAPGEKAPEPELMTISSDSVSVALDREKYPTRFTRGDLGATAPKEYAIVQLLCFDFADEIRPDLFSKTVEIESTGVTGKILRRQVRFRADNPAASVATFRFDAAVSLKQPYRYRILTVGTSGKQTVGNWQTGKPWPVALDITTQPGEKK